MDNIDNLVSAGVFHCLLDVLICGVKLIEIYKECFIRMFYLLETKMVKR